jgi:hypothetical protein
MGIAKLPLPVMLDVSEETMAALEALTRTGLFGRCVPEVAEAFVRDRIRDCVLEGWLPMAPPRRRRSRKGAR